MSTPDIRPETIALLNRMTGRTPGWSRTGGAIDVTWIEEDDPHVNPIGVKGIGEIGIVGTAAAIANAVYHATGIRVRDLPITLDKLLP